MQEIKGYDRSIQELLSGGSYGIGYYQREYKWGTKQLNELIDDLSGRFLDDFQERDKPQDVANYGHYFLGSIVVSKRNEIRHIIDGQQRLTTLTLLLIFLNNLQKEADKKVDVQSLIFADDFGEKKFKLNVPERNDCMEALYNQMSFDPEGKSESVKNLYSRYKDLEEHFPNELKGEVLLLFIYWLKAKVKLIEIIAYADEDAYTIFETVNDRGLSLSPTDMLKGYLLANVDNVEKRHQADMLFKRWLATFSEFGKDTEVDFFKAWLRAQYAQRIRERKKDSKPEDFDLIGTEYHRWVRNNKALIGIEDGNSFYRWIVKDLNYYAQIFVKLLKASQTRTEGLESIRYNANHGFTQQYQLLLAPISTDDDITLSVKKAAVVADYLDCWLNVRLWNFKSNSYSTVQYTIFTLGKEIRGKSLEELSNYLTDKLATEYASINFGKPTYLNQFSAKSLHLQLARFTDWLEQQCNLPGRYEDYIVRSGKNAYEIEHIWADHYERFADEFDQQKDFADQRNNIGDLILLPKKVNASLNDAEYQEKLPHYIKENLLAQSLHALCYKNNPGFRKTIVKYGLPFFAHNEFKKGDVEARNDLYSALASIVWSPKRLVNRAES